MSRSTDMKVLQKSVSTIGRIAESRGGDVDAFLSLLAPWYLLVVGGREGVGWL